MNPLYGKLIRHGLQFVASIFVTLGYVESDTAFEMATNLETVIGIGLSVGATGYMLYKEWKAKRSTKQENA